MKVGVLTLSLRANYGGTLQAWALMTVLRNMGHQAWFINRERHTTPAWKIPLRTAKRLVAKLVLRRSNYVISAGRERTVIEQHFLQFIDRHIQPQTCKYRSSTRLAKDARKLGFDAIVVGSDQVWRRNYIAKNITDYFLGFLPVEDVRTRRIAYAASFGTVDWAFTPRETETCAKLAQRFNAIGVREDSGVALCKQHLGIEAEHVIDPTLLLDAEFYLKLLPESRGEKQKRHDGILVYILDETNDKRSVTRSIAQMLGKPVFLVNKNTDDRTLALEDRIAPPVENWLRGFRDADFVVSDSFHGTVFAILFNKPFVALGNEQRGLSRFTSLLRMFRLEDRLITSLDTLNNELLKRDPDWPRVNSLLVQERSKAMTFLKKALG